MGVILIGICLTCFVSLTFSAKSFCSVFSSEREKMGDACPKLLDLMVAKERDCMVRDSGGSGLGVQEEKKLELKLGPPGAEDWGSSMEKKAENPSVLSLGYFLKASKTTKRGFFDTVNSKNEGISSILP